MDEKQKEERRRWAIRNYNSLSKLILKIYGDRDGFSEAYYDLRDSVYHDVHTDGTRYLQGMPSPRYHTIPCIQCFVKSRRTLKGWAFSLPTRLRN